MRPSQAMGGNEVAAGFTPIASTHVFTGIAGYEQWHNIAKTVYFHATIGTLNAPVEVRYTTVSHT